jgi:putative FmdB family regulatory protein
VLEGFLRRWSDLPLYEYRCPKDGTFERISKFSDPPLTACPQCGGPVEKLASAPAIQFKGSGWYVTDYARRSSGDSEAGKDKGASSEATKDASSESKETKPASSSSSTPSESGTGTTTPATSEKKSSGKRSSEKK